MWGGGLDHKKYRDVDQMIFEVSPQGFSTEPTDAATANTGGRPSGTA